MRMLFIFLIVPNIIVLFSMISKKNYTSSALAITENDDLIIIFTKFVKCIHVLPVR